MTPKLMKKVTEFAEAVNKEPFATKVFPADGTFKAFYAAEKEAKRLGYAVGSMCRNCPIALAPAATTGVIAKWWNLEPSEYPRITGGLISEDFREGDVALVLFEPSTKPEGEQP